MNWQRQLQWVWNHPRWLVYFIGGGAAISLALFLVTPKVEPFPPSELTMLSEAPSQPAEADDSLDFIFRPLFLKDRRSPEPVLEAETRKALPPAMEVESLEGVTLLGIFSSGESAGIIILREGERQRIYAGEAVMGWTLTDVHSRTAFFNNDAGGVAELSLALASSLLPLSGIEIGSLEPEQSEPPSVSLPKQPVIRALNGASSRTAASGSDEKKSSGPVPLVTFESIDEARRQRVSEEAADK